MSALVLALCLGLSSLRGPQLMGRLYVDDSAPPGGDGQNWATAYHDLQDALAAATARLGQPDEVEEIWIAEGTYTPTDVPTDPLPFFQIVPRASLYGGFGGDETSIEQRDPVVHPTILSGDVLGDDGPGFTNRSDNTYWILYAVGADVDHSTVIDGLTFRDGHAAGPNPRNKGAAAYLQVAGPLFRDCRFVSNWAFVGGAVYMDFGVNVTPPRFDGCRFEGNFALSGAGAASVANSSAEFAEFVDCQFVSNSTPEECGALGGSLIRVHRCSFVGNSARVSGALSIHVDGTVLDCVFVGNHAEDFGGALYSLGNSYTGAPLGNDVVIANCLFERNTSSLDGGAIYTLKSNGFGPTIVNCTLADNSAARNGGGVYLSDQNNSPDTWSEPFVRNCILWGNTDVSGSDEIAQVCVPDAILSIDACDVQGWSGILGGSGNFGLDPLFTSPLGSDGIPGTADDDYRPRPGSPCINAGVNGFLPSDVVDQDADGDTVESLPFDLDRRRRVFRSRVDQGAYEFSRYLQKSL